MYRKNNKLIQNIADNYLSMNKEVSIDKILKSYDQSNKTIKLLQKKLSLPALP